MNPLDSGDLDLNYNIQKVPATVFNPYIISFTEYPLDKGTLHLNGAWKVRNGIIMSNNNITLIDPRVGRRLKSKETKWLPLPLIMAFVRERGNIIDYKIPITGNLKDPKFHLRDVVLDLFQNIFIKPATFPYGLEVKSTEKEIEGSVALTWKMGQSTLERRQTRFVHKIARFLKDSKEARIDVYPQHYAVKEKEQILFFEAKKKYFLLTTKKSVKDFSYADSIKADKMSIKDLGTFFVKNLTKITRDTTMFTIQDKCNYFVDASTVNHSYKELVETRENSVRNLFVSNGTSDRLKMHQRENIIPYDGFSRLKLTYNGDMPKSLKASYEKMHRLNNKALRKKYFSR
jgi:hypothetical protein